MTAGLFDGHIINRRFIILLLLVVFCRSGHAIRKSLDVKPPAPRSTKTLLASIRGGSDHAADPSLVPIYGFLSVVDLVGTSLFAFSGAVTAGRKGMDIMGMSIIAFVTATGGGTLRDLLFNKGTVFWMQDVIYLQICGVTTLATYVLWPTLEAKLGWKDSAVPMCTADACGLAAFSVLGTQKAIGMDLNPMIWVVSGLMSSCFGGILRDILCLQRPRIMYPERSIYATPPLCGSIIYTLLTLYCPQLDKPSIASISFLSTFLMRVLSFNSSIRMPHWRMPSDVPEDNCDL